MASASNSNGVVEYCKLCGDAALDLTNDVCTGCQ